MTNNILKSIGLFLVITLGVTSGNLISNYLTTLAATHALKQTMAKANADAEKRHALNRQEAERAKAQQAINQERSRVQAERRRREAEQQQHVQQQLNRTCQFWKDEYSKSRKELDKIHRDNACREAQR